MKKAAPVEAAADRTLPGYTQALYWRISDSRRRVLSMYGLTLLALPVAALGFTWLAAHLARTASPGRPLTGPANALAIAGGILVMAVAHEGVHGLLMRAFGARPQFGIEWTLGAAYATAPGFPFRRNHFIVIALAPLLLLSAAGLLLAPAVPLPALVVALAFNAAGASGDVWMTALCLRYPADAVIMDERDGIRILLPQGPQGDIS